MKIAPRPKGHRRTRSEVVIDPPKVDIKCAECGGPMRLLRALDLETDEVRWLFWACVRHPACYCTHSAHPDGMPMGKPANAATRAARHGAHRVFDKLWKHGSGVGGFMSRGAAYRWLAEQFGEAEVHIGNMTIEQCESVNVLALKKLNELEHAQRTEQRERKRVRGRMRARSARYQVARERSERFEERFADSEPPPEPEEEPPRGRRPGRATVTARRYAAIAFDRIWQGGLMKQADATEWLRGKVKKRIEYCRLKEAERVERLCDAKREALIRERNERKVAERKAAEVAELAPSLYLETVDARSAGLELLQCLEESSLITLAEGVQLPDETDWLGLKEEIARQTLDFRAARTGRHPWWRAWQAWERDKAGRQERSCR